MSHKSRRAVWDIPEPCKGIGLITQSKSRKGLVVTRCAYCQKEILKRRDVVEKFGHNVFCCKEHSDADKESRIVVTCHQCGRIFLTKISRKRSGDALYCSKECRHQGYLGSNNPAYRGKSKLSKKGKYYGRNWKQRREEALLRDGGICRICHMKPDEIWGLHVHHIKPAKDFNFNWDIANEIGNLITVCYQCHVVIEPRCRA